MAKRPRFTQQDIQQQLSHLNLNVSTLSSQGSDLLAEQLAPVVVNIHRSRQQDAFLKALKQYVKEQETKIECVCEDNYKELVDSVDALLKVRQGTVTLRHRVIELNEDIQKSGVKVADKKKALLDTRRVGQNIDEAIDTLQACLRVLDMANRVNQLIQAGKHFSALRQIDELQSIHIKPVLHFPFANQMLAAIPQWRTAIRDAVTSALKAWMYEARSVGQQVGKGALEAMDQRNRRWAARKRKESNIALAKINGPIELSLSERHEYNVIDNDNVRIDCRPLYECIHIHDILDAREELQASYQADRRAQAFLLLSENATLSPFSLQALSALLEEIVGFFLIESHVLRTTKSFRSEQDVEGLWDDMCERVVKIVDSGLASCEDPDVFLGTKLKVLTFVQTLEGYGYTVEQLNKLLLALFERYSDLLQRKFSGDFEQIVLDDDHQSMVVNDTEEFEKVISVSWLPPEGDWSAEELAKPGFPLALPFSQTYPLCCIDIRSFTEQYYQFAEGFTENHREIDDVLRKALDNLLIKQVSENIQKRVAQVNNLSQLAQIVVNVLFFQTACSELENLLVTLRATQRGGTVHLESLASFKTTLDQTQNRIVDNITAKADSFFEEAQYDWQTLAEPRSREPSPYLVDLSDYISTVMMSILVQLPDFAKDFVHRGALGRCASYLMFFLLDKQPTMISDQALMYLDRDVRWIIQHETEMGNERLVDVFAELHQTLVLLTSTPNVLDYLNPEQRQTHFGRIVPRNLQSVLVKLVTFYNTAAGQRADSRRRHACEELLRAIARH